MKKKAKRKNYPTKLKIINIKAKASERKALLAMAKKYTDGNLSLWLRIAGLKYTPSKRISS